VWSIERTIIYNSKTLFKKSLLSDIQITNCKKAIIENTENNRCCGGHYKTKASKKLREEPFFEILKKKERVYTNLICIG
jgi:hypothetical protein